MRARAFRLGDEPLERAMGSLLAADVRAADGRIVLRKGTQLDEAHRAALSDLAGEQLHLVDLDAGELAQEDVARRLAAAAAGPGARAQEPRHGQARIRATLRGLLRVDAAAVRAVNALPSLLCFTLAEGRVVLEGDEVGGAKAATLATPEAVVREAEALLGAAGGAIAVASFVSRRVSVLITERLEWKARHLVADAIRRKIVWYGSELLDVTEVRHEPDAVAARLRAALDARAGLLLISGANALDPLDPVLVAIEGLGGSILRTGVPAHPGSMVWVGKLDAAPVLGIATCSGFGKNTSLDLLLARVLAGEDPARAAAGLGYGGLVEGPAGAGAFPPYERSAPTLAEPPFAD